MGKIDPRPLTDNQVRALKIIRDYGIVYASQFAHLYFPEDHPGWRRAGKCGPYGSSRGIGLRLSAGAYLGKLRQAGLINGFGYGYRFRLTEVGEYRLKLAEESQE